MHFYWKYYVFLAMWMQVVSVLSVDKCEVANSRSTFFIPWKVSYDACAIVGRLVRWSFLKNGGKMFPCSVGNELQCV
jgi:hypothetical protein